MCTYGDMMSLLLCFFIMLFALSTITPIKWEAFVETQQWKMGYTGRSKTPSELSQPFAAMSSSAEMSRRTAALAGGQPDPGPSGDNLNRQNISEDGEPVKGGLILFEQGSPYLTAQAKRDLEALLPTLMQSSNKIAVVGYTAPAEEEGTTFSRGIFIAQKRAIEVTEYLVSLGLQENCFEISISASIPNRAILPRGMPPRRAGASAAVYLIIGKPRPQKAP